MDCKLIYFMVKVLSFLGCCVIGVPLPSAIDSDDDSEIVEVVSNVLHETQDPNTIDLSIYGHYLYGEPDFNKTGNLVAKFKANESSVNPEELGSYLEGDILMPQNRPNLLKNGLGSKAYRWPNGIVPFEIANDFTKRDLDVITFAMDAYHINTCIRFKPRSNESDYIVIVGGRSGCWSAVGRMGGRQKVNFQTPGCLTRPGTAIHELMHVLGFMHEQNRKERDSFVDIRLQNVQRYAVPNFRKMPDTDAFGVKYDYGSVMHYSPTAFSSNGQPTIVAKRPINREIMGQRDGFSAKDIEKINRMYNCNINSKHQVSPVKLPPSRFPFGQGFVINRLGAFLNNILNGHNRL